MGVGSFATITEVDSMSPLMLFILGWLVGSFFGLSAVLGLVKGVSKPAAAHA